MKGFSAKNYRAAIRQLPLTNAALSQVGEITGADVVIAITASSGEYDRPEDIIGTWLAFILGGITFLILPKESQGMYPEMLHWKLLAILSAVLVGLIVGAVLARQLTILHSICYSQNLMTSNVTKRAKEVFANNHPDRIRQGILIYISMFEKTCTALADPQTTAEFSRLGLDVITYELTGRLASQHFDMALSQTIISAAERLKKNYPPQADLNPIADLLIM